jgi:proteasome lid subunit RPN8/RPN11
VPDAQHEQPHRPELDVSRVEVDSGALRPLTKLTNAREHGRSDTSVEVCGVLVGDLHHDRISPYLLIGGHIPGDKAKSKNTQVTFTAETWDAIQKRMEADHRGKKIVGWYHTHPGFGVFLSGMDLFIQDNFFNLPWQVAWVYDPVAGTDGAFVWREGRSERQDFLIEEDVADAAGEPDPDAPPPEQQPQPSSIGLALAIVGVFMACFVAVWYLLVHLVQSGWRVRLPLE